MHLVLPFAAAFVFAIGSIFTKRAFAEGARLGEVFVINSVLLGLSFQPLWLVDAPAADWGLSHRPIAAGLSFLAGHLLNFLAIRSGHVSIVTPLMGSKVVLVAFLIWAMGGAPLGPVEWFSAALTTAGVFLMGRSDTGAGPGSRWSARPILLALSCSFFFALCDVALQGWARDFGMMRFLPLQMATVAMASCLILPLTGGLPRLRPRSARKWLLLAAVCSTLQALLITYAIGEFRDATGVNVVYATRGMWAIALVWLAGRRLGNAEQFEAGARGLWMRLAGAISILAGVVLILVGGSVRR